MKYSLDPYKNSSSTVLRRSDIYQTRTAFCRDHWDYQCRDFLNRFFILLLTLDLSGDIPKAILLQSISDASLGLVGLSKLLLLTVVSYFCVVLLPTVAQYLHITRF